MSKHTAPAPISGESNLNLILAVKQYVRGEIAAVDAKITKREKEIGELRDERDTLIQLAASVGVSLTPDAVPPAPAALAIVEPAKSDEAAA